MKPYNNGSGMTNFEIIEKANKLKLQNFKYFMRDEMKGKNPLNKECGIINLNTSKQHGSHHCCYWKDKDKKYYFDSFGLLPPKELVAYLKSPIIYSTFEIQQFNDSNCSEWCLYVLNKLNKNEDYIDIILSIVNNKTY